MLDTQLAIDFFALLEYMDPLLHFDDKNSAWQNKYSSSGINKFDLKDNLIRGLIKRSM